MMTEVWHLLVLSIIGSNLLPASFPAREGKGNAQYDRHELYLPNLKGLVRTLLMHKKHIFFAFLHTSFDIHMTTI